MKPCLQTVECVFSRQVKAQEDDISALVKYASYRAERLLSCGIPDLQLADFVIQLDLERAEFHSNSHLVLHFELLILHAV